jgi:hypothetical protein
MNWDQFLLIRVLLDDKGDKKQVVDFLYSFFDDENIGVVSDTKVFYGLLISA